MEEVRLLKENAVGWRAHCLYCVAGITAVPAAKRGKAEPPLGRLKNQNLTKSKAKRLADGIELLMVANHLNSADNLERIAIDLLDCMQRVFVLDFL